MSVGRTLHLQIDGCTYAVQVEDLSADRATVRVDGRTVEVLIERPGPATVTPPVPSPPAPAGPPTAGPKPARPAAPADGDLCAVMPGVVTRVLVEPGQKVSAGEVLLILEAMKMENEIRSDREATVAKVHVAAGQRVQTGESMVSFA